ncbi:TIGR01459 family HAD-type hydrolase [uncultured Amaricoccus sp.]|uniref:TIGR01459 family HAD-type hydrolase n=1 Tax=uncultured Amaricoccus sp. TaxID=339341 RepID=UPI0026046F71|nr:TIGR01459 family HAD-type hydrolase [uncultured Amaricoccus sp.]
MTRTIQTLDDIGVRYEVLFCDLWGCLHDGVKAFPAAVAALERYRSRGGKVVLLTNSPRPAAQVAAQLDAMGAPRDCYDLIVSSGDAAQIALARGFFGRRVYHIGPARDLPFFADANGKPFDIERVPLEEAEGIVCTGLVDDLTETPDDYRAVILYGATKGLKLLCANPDIVVDMGDKRVYCAGAIAKAYTQAGGESFYFGKPYPPIYALAREKLSVGQPDDIRSDDILCIGDGIRTDIEGAMGESLDAVFVTGGLAAEETATTPSAGPDPARLASYLAKARMSPLYAMAYLR